MLSRKSFSIFFINKININAISPRITTILFERNSARLAFYESFTLNFWFVDGILRYLLGEVKIVCLSDLLFSCKMALL